MSLKSTCNLQTGTEKKGPQKDMIACAEPRDRGTKNSREYREFLLPQYLYHQVDNKKRKLGKAHQRYVKGSKSVASPYRGH